MFYAVVLLDSSKGNHLEDVTSIPYNDQSTVVFMNR